MMAGIGLLRKIGLLAKCQSGAIAVYAAITMPILVGAVGMSIDLAQVYLVRERLSRALDAAALAAAGSGLETEAEMQARVDEFMEKNYPAEKIGTTYDIHLEVDGDDVRVSASADYSTSFIRILGISEITVSSSSNVRKQVKGVEAVLVLDNTGSMGYTPPGAEMTNMDALKAATRSFVSIMFAKANDPEDVRIGLVPYANSVRIGLYGRGQVPDPATGIAKSGADGVYNGGSTFVTLPSGMVYTTSHNPDREYKWYGCVVEHKDEGYDAAAVTTHNTSSAGNRGQIWTTATSIAGHGWDPASGANDPYPQDVQDDYEGPWDVYNYGSIQRDCTQSHQECTRRRSDGSCRTWTTVCDQYGPYYFNSSSSPNSGCPYANVLPLSSSQTDIEAVISTMVSHGNTQGNAGLIWGYRMISPEEPFTEGSAWQSDYWKKAIIVMTDGDNTMDGTYSYLWASAKNNIYASVEDRPSGSTVPTLDDRVSAVCEALEENDVLVYTIVFQSEATVSDQSKAMWRACATEDDMYFYAPTQQALQETFAHIARELSNLHITD